LGFSSRPAICSKVDLPVPDGREPARRQLAGPDGEIRAFEDIETAFALLEMALDL
jgi:hypothetical protein